MSDEFNPVLKDRLVAAGAKIGHLSFALEWMDPNDLDLHIVCPCGTLINHGAKKCNNCGAELDVDMNHAGTLNAINPVEHIASEKMKTGIYKITVKFYAQKSHGGKVGLTESKFTLSVILCGKTLISWKDKFVSVDKPEFTVEYNYSQKIRCENEIFLEKEKNN